MNKPLTRVLMAPLLLGVYVWAQSPSDSVPTVETLQRSLASYKRLVSDWGGLTRYGSENAELPPPAAGVNRVVFLGDQITEQWGKGQAKFFPGKPYMNRGISGQTTPQMLVRFRQDVIALQPKVVVIQGGANDLIGLVGPGSEGTISDAVQSMTELAKVHGIRVVVASVTPICDCGQVLTERLPQGKIIGLNRWLKGFARESGAVYLDYYAALVTGRDFKRELTSDGLLPNAAGYELMSALAEQAIARALDQK